jgi:xylan 1,4-beta-xylosidase
MNRRDALKLSIASIGFSLIGNIANAHNSQQLKWARGIENQRKADLGNGFYLNPIVSGDRPDPSILRDGDDYYMTFSTFEAYPGLVIWHSQDLINWIPISYALSEYVGSVWAPELVKINGRFLIYFAVKHPKQNTIYVIHADKIDGQWSKPIDLGLHHHIDPGFAIGEDNKNYLFLSGGDRVSLSDDGLSVLDAPKNYYQPWKYPEDWDVEGFSPEGPKIYKRGKYFYIITAIGGTAGPPTGHMVIAARSKSIHGPWENCPNNPLVRSLSKDEMWWSRGHATIFDTKAGETWAVYHGYEKDFITLGRQTLLVPIKWSKDNWPIFEGGDLSKPIKNPKTSKKSPNGIALSDDFSISKIGLQWNFINPVLGDAERAIIANNSLEFIASGTAPSNSAPLGFVIGDRSYEIEVQIEIEDNSWGGLLLFYDKMLYCGLGFNATNFITHQYGIERGKPKNPLGKKMFMRLRNRENIISFFTSPDGKNWRRFDRGMEVSGYNHNVRGGFMMLKPALYSCGSGKVIYKNFKYRAL